MFKYLVLVVSTIVFLSADSISDQELHNAVRNSNMPMLKYLLEKSTKYIDEKDDYGYTPIHLAIRKDDIEITKYILEFNPDINTQDKFGDTPLIDSARNNNIEIVKLLICSGANKDKKNHNNQSALDFISENKQYETALFIENPKCEKDKEKQEKNLIEKLRKLK